MSDILDLGPLPQSDRNRELQKLSLKAFDHILPTDKFTLRDERIEDAGVDVSLELLINGLSTNMRAQVQLKGTDSSHVNKDGSVSLSIETSNINYLLNGQSPLYVLYIVPRNELRYAWTREERKRFDQANPQWMNQGTITLHFIHTLDDNAIQEIHRRILQEAQLQRQIYDTLSTVVTSEYITFSIDPTTLKKLDSEHLRDVLLYSGLTLADSGRAHEVLPLIDLLPYNMRVIPRILLIKSFAEYALGDYQSSLGSIGKTLLYTSELSIDDLQIASYVKMACEFSLGVIDKQEYLSRKERAISETQGVLSITHRLGYYRQVLSNLSQDMDFAKTLNDLRHLVDEIMRADSNSSALKLHAEIILLDEEGKQYLRLLFRRMMELETQKLTRYNINVYNVMDIFIQQWLHWISKSENILERSQKQGNLILIGEAILTHMKIVSARLMLDRLQMDLILPSELTPELLQIFETMLVKAIHNFDVCSNIEGSLRGKLILADVYMLFNQESRAKELARQSLPIVQAMGYKYLQKEAEDLINGTTIWHNTRDLYNRFEEEDEDFRLAHESEEGLYKYARHFIKALQLPVERLPIVLQDVKAMQGIAQERMQWCQYIDLQQNLRHTESVDTLYKVSPKQFGWCTKYDHKSHIGDTNWTLIVDTFKEVFCKNCPSRSPKKEQ